jgi:hypothetical protein
MSFAKQIGDMSPDPRVPSADGYCHLFRLSGEIRNLIYAYTLAVDQDGPLRYRTGSHGKGSIVANGTTSTAPGPTKRKKPGERTPDANQLRLVNRQLRQETHGLILRYNDLKFGSIAYLTTFLKSCPSFQFAHLRILEVSSGIYLTTKPHAMANSEAVVHIFEFCRQNPHVMVRNRYGPSISASPINLVFWASCAEFRFRGSARLMKRIITSEMHHLYIEDWLRRMDIHSLSEVRATTPPNFRIFPKEKSLGELDLVRFRQAVLNNPDAKDLVDNDVEGGIETWVHLLKEIVQDGI